jgi:hypothetical protein
MSRRTSVDLFSKLRKKRTPKETFGMCEYAVKGKGNSRPCGNFNVVLGDGLCVNCWDLGRPIPESMRRRR